MSGLESITNKIILDAKVRADEIIATAEHEADEIKLKATTEAENAKNTAIKNAEAEGKKAHDRAISAAVMQAKKIKLAAKQRMIDECFTAAHEQILKMNPSEYEELLVELLVSSSATGDEEVIFSEADSDRIDAKRVINRANSKLKIDGAAKPDLKLSAERVAADGGFLLKKGDVIVNNTVKALIASKRETLEIELAAILFKEIK